MAINYEALVTPELVRELFSDSIIDETNKGYCITLAGKILAIDGKVFFRSHDQAMKAFYNSYSWRAKRELWRVANPNTEDYYGFWSSPERTAMWRAFKKVLERDFGFKIVRA